MNKPELFSESNAATYCPEDNKLRLYIGRVSRDEYDALRAEGWHTTPKQSEAGKGEFAATWTPAREDTAISYAGIIGDEDAGPAERAADRAERFAGYLGKRLDEAGTRADEYESTDTAHGFQNQQRAERAAARHDRKADRAINSWDKAEYWHARTNGVISHALYVSTPGVRMGRIKVLEAEQRKAEKTLAEYATTYRAWKMAAAEQDADKQRRIVEMLAGNCCGWRDYKHPRPEECKNEYIREHGASIYSLLTLEENPITPAEAIAMWFKDAADPEQPDNGSNSARWRRHYENRLAYERQMLDAQGGRAGDVEMIPGGWIRGGRRLGNEERQIVKVNKSPATGRVVSVLVRDNRASSTNHYGNPYPDGVSKILSHTVEVERLAPDAYRAPTEEELSAFKKAQAEEKAERKETSPKTAPLVNPTEADAERLQSVLNAKAKADNDARQVKAYGKVYTEYKPSTVFHMTQAQYSAYSKGTYGRGETRGLCKNCELEPRASNMWRPREEEEAKRRGPAVCKIRMGDSDGSDYGARRMIVLTDKAQKALPVEVWPKAEEQTPPAVPCGYEVSPGRCSQPGTNSGTVPTHCANCESGTAQAKAARAGIQAELFAEVGA